MNKWKKVLTGTILTVAASASSAAIINFEDYSAGTVIDNEYVGSHGVTINGMNVDRGISNMAVVFDTENPTGGDSDLGAPFFNNGNLGQLSPGNVLIIHENVSDCDNPRTFCDDPDDEGSRPAGYFDISFSSGVTLNSIDFFDVETAENGTSSNNLITLFDMNDQAISLFYTPDTGGDNMWDRLNFNVNDVWSMRIKLHGSGAIDNINYSVTEPGSLALLGLGLISLVIVRRRQA